MKKENIDLTSANIECYYPDQKMENPILDVYISLGIPRNGPNLKSYHPGTFFEVLLMKFAKKNINACIVGVPGMGGSSGNTFQSSIEERALHLSEIIQRKASKKIWLIGYSMGGPIVLLMQKKHRLVDITQGVTFLAPAAYPLGSEDKLFGPSFKNAIRGSHPNAVWYADYLANLPSSMHCHLMLACQDKTIPPFIEEAYKAAIEKRQGQQGRALLTYIPNASHALIDGDWDSSQLAQELIRGVEDF